MICQLLETVRLFEVCARLQITYTSYSHNNINKQRVVTLTHCDNKIMAHKRQKICFPPGRGIAPLTPELFSRVTLICWVEAQAFLFPSCYQTPSSECVCVCSCAGFSVAAPCRPRVCKHSKKAGRVHVVTTTWLMNIY